MTTGPWRRRVVAAVSGLLACGAVAGASGADAAPSATKPPLGGLAVDAIGAPISILLYTSLIPVPHSPEGEMHLSYSQVHEDSGPSIRAVASTAWPGATIGDGFGAVTGGKGPNDYPVKQVSNYPTGPAKASQTLPSGSGMTAQTAKSGGTALATLAGSPVPLITVDSMQSKSTGTYADQLVTSVVSTSAKDVGLLDGLIRIKDVQSTLTTSSDGAKATADGKAEVSGLTVAGIPFSVDDKGVHAGKVSGPAVALLGGPNAVLSKLGLSFDGATVTKRVAGAAGRAAAHALVLSVDTATLHAALADPLLGPLQQVLPPDLEAQLSQYFSDTPKIVFLIGDASSGSAASPGFNFTPPPFPSISPPPAAPSGGGGGGSTPSGGGGPSVPVSSLGDGGGGPSAAPPPDVAPGGGGEPVPPVQAAASPAGFGGLSAGAVLAVLALAALGGWGLTRGGGLVFGGGSRGCALGARSGVPDLRRD